MRGQTLVFAVDTPGERSQTTALIDGHIATPDQRIGQTEIEVLLHSVQGRGR